jgi:hypothetical protein
VPVQPAQVPAHCTAKTWARFTAKIVPPRVVVLHQTCDEPSCTRPDHLRAGSQAKDLASSAGWRHTGRADRRGMAGADPGHPVRPDRRLGPATPAGSTGRR